MARTNEEWAALLGSTLCKMARVYGTDAPNAYLPEECYPVIEQTLEVALKDARAEGYAAALRDLQQNRALRTAKKQRLNVIGQVIRALPLARRTA
jgi:hypothetical protein